MKKLTFALLVTIILMATGVGLADDHHHDRDQFSNKSLKGNYTVIFRGTNSGSSGPSQGTSLAPVNGVGLLTADGNGNFTGSQTANILFNTNGQPTSGSSCPNNFPTCDAICTTTLTGTYSINSDGTGTTTATATPVAGSDSRCGPAGGFTTTSYIVMQGRDHLVFVGTDLDSTVRGTATHQDSGR